MLRPQEFNSGHLKKRKQMINDEALRRQENLQAKFHLIEAEFKKHENEKLFPELNPLKSASELAVFISPGDKAMFIRLCSLGRSLTGSGP